MLSRIFNDSTIALAGSQVTRRVSRRFVDRSTRFPLRTEDWNRCYDSWRLQLRDLSTELRITEKDKRWVLDGVQDLEVLREAVRSGKARAVP